MKAKLDYCRFGVSSARSGHDLMVATLIGSFSWEGDRRGHPALDLEVYLDKDRDAPIAALEQLARDQAIAVLREALHQLEAHSLADLDREPPPFEIEPDDQD